MTNPDGGAAFPQEELKRHLWEMQKPYYMADGCYHENGMHKDYNNWDTFLSEWGNVDIDYNRIHRFDARLNSPDWGDDVPDGQFVIHIYRVFQRKGYCASQSVFVPLAREQEVIDYLRPYFEQEMQIWAPFSDALLSARGEPK